MSNINNHDLEKILDKLSTKKHLVININKLKKYIQKNGDFKLLSYILRQINIHQDQNQLIDFIFWLIDNLQLNDYYIQEIDNILSGLIVYKYNLKKIKTNLEQINFKKIKNLDQTTKYYLEQTFNILKEKINLINTNGCYCQQPNLYGQPDNLFVNYFNTNPFLKLISEKSTENKKEHLTNNEYKFECLNCHKHLKLICQIDDDSKRCQWKKTD